MAKKSSAARVVRGGPGRELGQRSEPAQEVERRANMAQQGFVAELRYMIMQNKAWWLVPILVMLVLLSALVFLGGTAAAPFIYTLF